MAESGPSAHADAEPFTGPVGGLVEGRSSELASLSRDHQHALARALELKRARAETAAGAWQNFLAFWRADGSRHFSEEETLHLPAYGRVADPNHPAVVRTLLEHVLIRAKVAELQSQGEPAGVDLNLLGSWLELHVRHEERVLFPLIEAALPVGLLSDLGAQLAAAAPQ